ncbi:cyclin-dependent protein kinase inhibitor SMR9 [Salvia hispanica]|uniref:cyclin-dependent protein kinase inhibitor SMR9 n=1 Tax=Salvia hispanica TaxID=49212 RepID=UPI00200967B2|nr:cyclin-dependent protein kinase inhibitor SMR9 [Salvia hispanica]
MTPSYTKKTKRRRRRSSRSPSSSSRRIIEKKHFNSPAPVNEVEVEILDSGSSTPKGERFRIPEMTSCPPAPKKRRIRAAVSCSLRRKPTFFASPDIDLFFYFALRGVPFEC